MFKPAVDRRSRASDPTSGELKSGAGYGVYDPVGQKIGRAEGVFVNLDGEPVYVMVRMGFFGTRKVLIPVQFVETDEESNTLVLK